MKSIKQQYIDLMEGRMSQHNFMRSLRMTLPQYVTNVTSFKDSVRILKNKGILSEAMGGDPIEATLKSYLAKGNSYAEAIELTAAEQGMDEEVLMSQYPQDAVDTEGYEDEESDEFIDMIAKAEEEEAGKYTKNYDFPGGLGEGDDEDGYPDEDYVDPDLYDGDGMDASEGLNEKSYKVSPNAISVSSLKKGDILGGSGLEVVSISAGAKTPSGKIEVTVKDPKTGNEVTKVWNKATKVTVKKEKLDEALNKDIKQFGQDLGKYLTNAGFKVKFVSGRMSDEDMKQLKTNTGLVALEADQNPSQQSLYMHFNPKEVNKIEGIVNKFQLSPYSGKVMAKGWTSKQVVGALNPGDIFKADSQKGSGLYQFFRLAKVDTKVQNVNEGKGKELNPNQIHPQELRMGIKVELEHTDNLDKAKKIALDHLAENPFYYTALKLSGIESPSAPKVKAPVAFKKEVAAAVDLVDKINAMKPVKGFEKAKASSNKAKKETNSGVKGVSELTHNAKSVRGLQKFAATGGKMKAVREGQLNEAGGEYTFTGTLTKDEMKELDNILSYKGKYDIEVDEVDDHYETTISHDFYNELNLKDAVDQVTGRKPQKKQFGHTGGFGNVLQSQLEALVREVLSEMYDGGSEDLAAMARSSNALRHKPETQAIAKKAAESANNKEEAASLAVKLAKAKGITDSEQITHIVDLATSKFMNEMFDGRDDMNAQNEY